jgi:hypothetical protein
VLARVGPLDFPLRDTWAWWPIQFQADLEEGNWYHVIFWSVHPSPENNYASYEYLSHEKDAVPENMDWVIWTKKFDENSPWVRNDDYSSENYGGMEASILLQWEDNTFWGQGYISAMADPPRPKIYGNNVAGEFFIADEDRIVERITIRISRLGTPKDHIYIRLEDENSELLFESTLANASEVPQFDPYDGNSKDFFTLQLTPPVQLKEDSIYRLILSSPNSDSEDNSFVLSCPVYSSSNTSNDLALPSTILTWQGRDRGYLITSTNGGNNWNSDQNADISFYFSSMSPLDITEDINMDGTVDTIDVQLCVNAFLGTETSPDIIARADINNDGIVDLEDMEMVIEEIIRVW